MKKLILILLILLLFPFAPVLSQTIFPVPKYPYETCIIDYDLDGDNDIIVGCSGPNQDPDSIVFFINDGWGNFEKLKFETPNQIALFCNDLTGDSYPDIITETVDNIIFYENNKLNGILGDEHVIMNLDCHPNIGGITDINGDDKNDILYYCAFIPYSLGVQFNNGDNTFTDSAFVESNETLQMAHSGDINNDNNPDILITTLDQSESIRVLYNHYPGFTEQVIATPDWNRGYVLNVNNDNLNDILLARPLYDGSTRIVNMLNEFDYFQACDTLVFVNGTAIKNICDYNLDGYDDLSMTVYQANNQPIEDSVYIYFNDQECGYSHVQSVYMGDYAWLPTINSGDLNSDGYPDLAIQGFYTPLRESIRILWNDGTGHFIDTNSVYVGEKEIQLQNQVSLYPNPTSGKLVIRSGNQKIKSIQIMDLNGRILFQKKKLHSQTYFEIDLTSSLEATGLYFCVIQLENDEFVFKKVIVTKN